MGPAGHCWRGSSTGNARIFVVCVDRAVDGEQRGCRIIKGRRRLWKIVDYF